MDLNEFFGESDSRPDHPDFWRLSECVLRFDGRMQEARTEEEKHKVWTETVGALVDEDSITYMAMQRAMHVVGVTNRDQMRQKAAVVAALTSVYIEAFLVGCHFQNKGGKQ